MKIRSLLFVLGFIVVGCGSNKGVTTKKSNKTSRTEPVSTKTNESQEEVIAQDIPEVYANSTEEYIAIYSDIAQDEMRLYDIPASITLAQGILESASGKGRLSVEANNHFGIKCHEWTGAKIYHDDDASQECFRKYKNSKYSFRDHSIFFNRAKTLYEIISVRER